MTTDDGRAGRRAGGASARRKPVTGVLDAPTARLRVLTAAAFVASKLASWTDREAPRDLYDLWALAKAGKIDGEAAEVFARWGPYTSASRVSLARIPTDGEWETALGHQCRPEVGPDEAAQLVREALELLA